MHEQFGGGSVPHAARRQALVAEPGRIWSATPSTVHVEFANRMGSGTHPDDVFRQLVAEIAEHHATGQINNRDAHRAANEAFGRLLMSRRRRHGARKRAWTGWGPSNRKERRHRVAGWEWDGYQNGYVATAARDFECSCGEPVAVPSYHNCKCGKIWNTMVIGTGGDRHQASAETFIAREIPSRKDVIVAKNNGRGARKRLQSAPQKKHDDSAEELDESASDEFPTKHSPKVDARSKGVQDGKSTKDWHKRDHGSQQFRG